MLKYSGFIRAHRNDDVRELALRQSLYSDVDIRYVAEQIAAWQMARKKLPSWAEKDDIIYPAHLSMEQCSSQMTAEYKAGIISEGETMTDLTAGFGVDATIIGRKFKKLIYVEKDESLCKIANHNLPLMGIKDFEVVNADGVEVLITLPHQSLIYLDPARRDEHGGKTIQISDCTPDVTQLQDLLLEKADNVVIKLSPMLDISNILRELKCVREIHIVSVENECKEILVKTIAGTPCMEGETQKCCITCVNIGKEGTDVYVVPEDERTIDCQYTDEVSGYIYEPNASIMKAKCFKSLARTYNIYKLHPSSHLYTSCELINNFPGRTFKVESIYSLKDKELKNIKKANLTIRNFPSTVAELRKRLKISEGGSDYLFATTLADESKVIIKTRKG